MNGSTHGSRDPRQRPRRLIVLVTCALTAGLWACKPEPPIQKTNPTTKSAPKAWEGEDILALWAKRYERVPAGSFDAELPKLPEKQLGEVVDRIFTALSTGRSMQRFAKTAREELYAQPDEAVAGLAVFLADPENDETSKARALALFAGKPHPTLTTLCLQHLDDKPRLVRLECVRRIDEAKSLGTIPRLLRRTREFYEEDPEILATIYQALAHVGNLSGLDTLLAWLGRDDLRAQAGTALIDIVALYGPAYVESDGWAGLANKAIKLRDAWKAQGKVAFSNDEVKFTQEDRYLLDREFWLLLRLLNGMNLRVVDEARFVGEHAGVAMVPLLRESLRDQRLRQRYHALEVFIALGPVGKDGQGEVRALLDQTLTRSYALNAYGCMHGDGALALLLGVLSPPASGAGKGADKDEQIAALAGLTGLESPDAYEFLRKRFEEEKDIELKAWIARAWIASGRGARKVARSYLQGLFDDKAFHEPTLRDMLREANR